MKMIHKYEDFCQLYDEGVNIKPDVSSPLGYKSVQYLIKQGWKIHSGGLFRKSRTIRDLLEICRKTPQNFELAYKHAGIDFWVYNN